MPPSIVRLLSPLLFSPLFLRPDGSLPKLPPDSPVEAFERPDKPRRGQRAHLRAARKLVELQLRGEGIGNRARRREVARRFKFSSF